MALPSGSVAQSDGASHTPRRWRVEPPTFRFSGGDIATNDQGSKPSRALGSELNGPAVHGVVVDALAVNDRAKHPLAATLQWEAVEKTRSTDWGRFWLHENR